MSSFKDKVARAGSLTNYISNWSRYNFKSFWMFLQAIPGFNDLLNQFYLCSVLKKFIGPVPRIPRYTLKNDVPCLETMYDESRSTYSRLLPRAPEYTRDLPPLDLVTSLFMRDSFTPESNQNLSVLISYYAQWFTHQFFNTNPADHTRTNQPVGINLSQLYGSTPEIEKSVRSYENGLLKSSTKHGQEFPEIIPAPDSRLFTAKEIFNMPIPVANKIPGFAAVHVLFFRRHQFVARELALAAAADGKHLSDEEIFQKAKVIVAINVLRLTMHDYVARSLQSSHVKIRFDHGIRDSLMWKICGPNPYHPINAIQIEFNLLYRWHQLYPDSIKTVNELPNDMSGAPYDVAKFETSELKFPPTGSFLGADWEAVNALTETPDAVERILFSAARQRAGKLTLLNTNQWLAKNVIKAGLEKCREYELASYNDYREHFGFGRMTSFEQISSDERIVSKLKSVYKNVDQIEYYPGIFAEDKDLGGVHGPFLATIGVGMTYCGIFASRLFDTSIINNQFLTTRGVELANEINYLQDITSRHTRLADTSIRFTLPRDAGPNAGL